MALMDMFGGKGGGKAAAKPQMASKGGLYAKPAGKPAPMQPRFTSRDESAVSPLVLVVMSYANQ